MVTTATKQLPIQGGPGVSPADLEKITDREIHNQNGYCRLLEQRLIRKELVFPERRVVAEDLRLIYGIGPATAARLKSQGFQQISQLLSHPRWGRAAAEVQRALEGGDLDRLASYGAAPLQLLSFFSPEAVRFVDIETTGLYSIYPLFLVGILRWKDGAAWSQQFLARDYQEEAALLRAALTELQNAAVLISFNGRSFDLPYLQGRLRFHRLEGLLEGLHLDLLRPVRQRYRGALPNCRLLTLEEQLLKWRRPGDISGAEVAQYYQEYLTTGSPDYLEPILLHNLWDLLAMAGLLGLLAVTK